MKPSGEFITCDPALYEHCPNNGSYRCELYKGAMKSAAGWYPGAACMCGPYTRYSDGYYATRAEAEEAMEEICGSSY